MTYQQLDFVFPFIVFAYGVLMTLVLNSEFLMKLAEERFPQNLVEQMNGHRVLAVICLFVGGIWSLQNLWV